jgi:hypothetical protein
LREEHRLRVFENRVLRRIFGPKSEEDASWRKFHNDELHSLYSSPNIVRVIKSRNLLFVTYVTVARAVLMVLFPEGHLVMSWFRLLSTQPPYTCELSLYSAKNKTTSL